MTNQTTTGMTTQEKVELICTNMMGWEKVTYNKGWRNKATVLFLENPLGKRTKTRKFNPYENWEDWRQVEEKIMEDYNLWTKFACDFCGYPGDEAVRNYMEADLPTRCDALISIISNK